MLGASMMMSWGQLNAEDNRGVSPLGYSGSYYSNTLKTDNLLVPIEAMGHAFEPNDFGFAEFPQNTSYSFGMWYKTSGVGGLRNRAHVMAVHDDKEECYYWFHYGISCNASGEYQFEVRNNAGGLLADGVNELSLGTHAMGEWHYLVVSVDNVNKKLGVYFDGTLATDGLVDMGAQLLISKKDEIFNFGYFGSNQVTDEVHFFNRALSAEDVAEAYKNPANVDGVTAIYTLNDVKAGTTGTFENKLFGGVDVDATYVQKSFGKYWGEPYALCYYDSRAEFAPTFNAGREFELPSIDVNVVSKTGGSLVVTKDGAPLNNGANTLTSYDVVNVVATPADGYALVGITAITGAGNINVVSGSDVTVCGNTTFMAEFTNSFSTLTVKNDKEIPYTLLFRGTEVTNLNEIIPGQEYNLTLDIPYEFVINAVKVGDKEIEAVNGVYTFTVDGDATLTIDASDKPQHIVSLYVAKINDQTPGAVVVTDQFGKEYSYQYQYIYEGTVLTLSNTHNEGYAFLHYMIGDGETMEPFVGKTVTVTGGMVIEGVFEEGPNYPEMSRTFTNGVNQQNRYIKSLEVTGTLADGFVFNAETEAELGREDFPVEAGEYSTVGAVINKTGVRANPIRIDEGTEQFTFQFLPWTEAFRTASGVSCNSELNWTQFAYYVDWNRDGDFVDEGEYVTRTEKYPGDYSVSGENTKVVTVPAGIVPGKYRMRLIFHEPTNSTTDWTTSVFDDNRLRCGVAYDFDIIVEGAELENARTVTIAANYDEAGSVAIVKVPDVEEGATQVTTKWKYVSMEATPKGDAQLVNWVDKDGVQMTTESVYTYTGTEDAEFIANFGYAVNYNSDANGTLSVTLGSVAVASGQYVAYGDEVTVTPVAQPGYVLKSLTVNDQPVELTDGAYTFTLEATTNIVAEFAERTYTLSLNVVSGNGKIIVGSNADDNGLADAEFENGAVITDDIAWFAAAVAEAGEHVSAVEYTIGDEAPVRVYTVGDELPVYSDEVTEWAVDNGVGFFLEASKNDVIINAWFSVGGVDAIEGVDADNAEGVVEYYNLQGVKVAAENLAPGFYIARQGNKVAKILINK